MFDMQIIVSKELESSQNIWLHSLQNNISQEVYQQLLLSVSELDFKEKEHPLFVSSCGTYHLLNKPKLPTHRPRGRLDYQILYSIRKSTFLFSWTRKNCNRRQYRYLPPQRRTTLLLLRC